MSAHVSTTTDAAWAQLEEHFRHHASLVNRFKKACPVAVVGMWRTGTNELGERLTPLERSALVERYCELFGDWPPEASAPGSLTPAAGPGAGQGSGARRRN